MPTTTSGMPQTVKQLRKAPVYWLLDCLNGFCTWDKSFKHT